MKFWMIPTFLATAETFTQEEKMTFAWQTPILGIVVIFAVLALLWGVIELLHLALNGFGRKKKADPASAPVAAPAPADEAPVPVAADDGEELVAAIVAAISALRDEEGIPGGFRVVSFKRAGINNAR